MSQIAFDFEAEYGPTQLQLLTPDEIFDRADEGLLRALEEDKRLERKPANYGVRHLGDYCCMWANTPPHGGLVVVGIRNDTAYEGCSTLGQERLNKIEKVAATYCPDARIETRHVAIKRTEDQQDDFLIVIRVRYHGKRLVRTSAGKVFVRRGDSKVEIREPSEIRQLEADLGQISFENEPVDFSYPDDFDQVAIATFAEIVRQKKDWSDQHSAEKILDLLHLGKLNNDVFTPNVACALLFAKDPRKRFPGCRIRFLRFEGEHEGSGEKWNAVKDEFLDGTVPEQIRLAESVLESQLRDFSRIGAGGKFYTSPEYPKLAWYEAIVNACVHRSYGNGLMNMNVFIKLFDDRLVVESPGPFPPMVTPDNIYEVHSPRNPYLMDAMFFMKYVKCANEGCKRIRSEMLEQELPEPEFRQDTVGNAIVRVTLRNNIKQRKVWIDADIAPMIGAQVASGLSEDEKRCINFIAEHDKISVSDAQRLTGKTWPAARKMLDRLVNIQLLEHKHRDDIDRDPQARYVLRAPAES